MKLKVTSSERYSPTSTVKMYMFDELLARFDNPMSNYEDEIKLLSVGESYFFEYDEYTKLDIERVK